MAALQITDLRLWAAIVVAMVLVNIALLRWADHARLGRLKRWFVVSLGLGVTIAAVGGYLTGQWLVFGFTSVGLAPFIVGLEELGAWHAEVLKKQAERAQEEQDLTLRPFLKERGEHE